MGKWKKRKKTSEQGEIMLESILVMIPTLFVLIFLLSLGFLLYQQWNVQFMADDIASKVAASYKYIDEDLPTGEISVDEIRKTKLYKYLLSNDKYKANLWRKANNYGEVLSKKTTFGTGAGNEAINAKLIEDSMSRRHIEVTVTGTYTIPFSEGLEIFGIKGTRTISAKSYAECIDVADYLNTVTFRNQVGSIVSDKSKVIKMVNTWIKLFADVVKLSGK